MKPYYSDGKATIYHGRWQDVLPQLDDLYGAVVTDPPYGTGGWRRPEVGAGSNPRAGLVREEWDNGAVDWIAAVAGPVVTFWPPSRTSQILQAAIATGRVKHRAVYLRKPDPKPQVGGRIRWSIEPVWVLSEEGFTLYGGDDLFVASAPREGRDAEASGHPYEKPLPFMRWLIEKVRVQLILDPFMGSGTTLRAAKDLGGEAIGIEQDERWCEIAANRCRQEALGLDAA